MKPDDGDGRARESMQRRGGCEERRVFITRCEGVARPKRLPVFIDDEGGREVNRA
jgi:hypothetical protein